MIERGSVGICAVCRRQEAGFGVKVNLKLRCSPILWLCDAPDCLHLARETKDMRQDEFNEAEAKACVKGGNAAGAYLDQIGKTDLAILSKPEWEEFCRRMVAGYRADLKAQLKVWATRGVEGETLDKGSQ